MLLARMLAFENISEIKQLSKIWIQDILRSLTFASKILGKVAAYYSHTFSLLVKS